MLVRNWISTESLVVEARVIFCSFLEEAISSGEVLDFPQSRVEVILYWIVDAGTCTKGRRTRWDLSSPCSLTLSLKRKGDVLGFLMGALALHQLRPISARFLHYT
ncbi:hypothetical protein M758_5G147200 [Ceratodon purpureus]|nr:hypothetical protein M758_5G147200 [Ceratodon purpureus]